MQHRVKKTALAFACTLCFCVVQVLAQNISTVAGSYSMGYTYTGDGGPATDAGMKYVYCVNVDAAGNMYMGEANRVVRKVNTAGVMSTIAGNGTGGYSGDGGPATDAQMSWPIAVAVDGAGNVFIVDHFNSAVRKVNTAGIISTVAGTGTPGYSGDGGPATAAMINTPHGLAVDAAGNFYISDNHRIRKVSTSGIITSIAGTGVMGYSGDGGPATAATMRTPGGIVIDPSGNVIFTDRGNNVVRKISTSGTITTIAGNGMGAGMSSGMGGYTGDGGPATLASMNDPHGVALDGAGNLYISDFFSHVVRRVDPSGTINTYAGTGVLGYAGDGGIAQLALLNWAWGLACDASGRLLIADELNYVVRRVETTSNSFPSTGSEADIVTCNDVPVPINTALGIMDPDAGQTETWSVFTAPVHGTLSGFTTSALSTGTLVIPSGLIYTPAAGYLGTDSFTVQVSDGVSAIRIRKSVTVDTGANAGTLTGPDTVCVGDNIVLSNSVTGGSWTRSNNTASVIAGTVTGVTPGVDTIYYLVSNDCETDTARKVVYVLPASACVTRVAGMAPGVVYIFPNPAHGSVTIETTAEILEANIIDITGMCLRTEKELLKGRVMIDRLLPGHYVVQVKTKDNVYHRQLIVN